MHTFEWLQHIPEENNWTVAVLNDYVDKWIRDPNLGLYRSDLKLHRVAKTKSGKFRIIFLASDAAIKAVLSNWGGRCHYKVDGLRYVTKEQKV